jgi:hypothetical protein
MVRMKIKSFLQYASRVMKAVNIWFVLFGLVLAVSFASATEKQESTQEDFTAYCQVLKGRFIAEITWATDWGAFAKKGDKMTAYWEAKLAEDNHLLIGRFLAGKGSDTAFTLYHPSSKQIKTVWVDTNGGVGESVTSRKGCKWVQLWNFTKPDGAKVTMTNTLTVSNNGNTHTWHRIGEDGNESFESTEVWQRVSDK